MKKNLELHATGSSLRDIILGGQDGLVNVLGVVLGVAATNANIQILIAAGLAATFAESISMGAVAYTSTQAQKDYYEKEKKREIFEVENYPEQEKNEIREIYAKKGFKGDLLEQIVTTVSSNKETFVEIMMDEELHLQPVAEKSVLISSFIVGFSALLGSLIPVAPFFLLPKNEAVAVSIVLSGLSLFFIGAYKAKTLVGNWLTSGIQMTIIGLGAAAAGFVIGNIFQAPAGI